MTEAQIILVTAFPAFAIGLWLGAWAADRKWRRRGNHEYMNRMESGGHLYQVKNERSSG